MCILYSQKDGAHDVNSINQAGPLSKGPNATMALFYGWAILAAVMVMDISTSPGHSTSEANVGMISDRVYIFCRSEVYSPGVTAPESRKNGE